MTRFKILLIIIFIQINVFSQDNKLIQGTIDFILLTYKVHEINPVHKDESELIDSVFRIVLLDYFEIQKFEVAFSTDYLFNLLYLNSDSWYEDSPDVRRMKTRRSLCFAAIALKTDSWSSFTFFDYAEYSMLYQCPDNIEPSLESGFCGLLFIELLYAKKNNNNNKLEYSLKRIESFILENQDHINKQIRNKANYLINGYNALIK